MLEYVNIRDGSGRWSVRADAIHEWPIVSWRAAMKHMVQGGWLNHRASAELAEWFPETIKAAEADEAEAKKAYQASYRPLREVPKEDRERQKYLNQALHVSCREARVKTEKLKARYLEFLAAKAQLKKE